MRLFLDANVLFTAAHNPSGKAALILDLGKRGSWAISTSAYAAEEARRNMECKFPLFLDRLNELLRGIELAEHHPDLRFPHRLAEKDRPIFQAAMACGATHLLTGDLKDFGAFMNRPECTFDLIVQTVADFLDSLLHREAEPITHRASSRPPSAPN